jgi:hypothetical protein
MTVSTPAALKMRRIFHSDAFRTVARGRKKGGVPAGADQLHFYAASNDVWPENDLPIAPPSPNARDSALC